MFTHSFAMTGTQFRALASVGMHSATPRDNVPVLENIQLVTVERSGNIGLMAVASDRYTAARARVMVDEDKPFEALIPAKQMIEIARKCAAGTSVVLLSNQEKWRVDITSNKTSEVTSIGGDHSDGNFPAINRLFEKAVKEHDIAVFNIRPEHLERFAKQARLAKIDEAWTFRTSAGPNSSYPSIAAATSSDSADFDALLISSGISEERQTLDGQILSEGR